MQLSLQQPLRREDACVKCYVTLDDVSKRAPRENIPRTREIGVEEGGREESIPDENSDQRNFQKLNKEGNIKARTREIPAPLEVLLRVEVALRAEMPVLQPGHEGWP